MPPGLWGGCQPQQHAWGLARQRGEAGSLHGGAQAVCSGRRPLIRSLIAPLRSTAARSPPLPLLPVPCRLGHRRCCTSKNLARHAVVANALQGDRGSRGPHGLLSLLRPAPLHQKRFDAVTCNPNQRYPRKIRFRTPERRFTGHPASSIWQRLQARPPCCGARL